MPQSNNNVFSFEPVIIEHNPSYLKCTIININKTIICMYCDSFRFHENCSFYVKYPCSNDLNLVDINGNPVQTCVCNCSISYDPETDNHYYTYNENKTKDDCIGLYLECKTVNDFMMYNPKINESFEKNFLTCLLYNVHIL